MNKKVGKGGSGVGWRQVGGKDGCTGFRLRIGGKVIIRWRRMKGC